MAEVAVYVVEEGDKDHVRRENGRVVIIDG
jgi:hypothetical protein